MNNNNSNLLPSAARSRLLALGVASMAVLLLQAFLLQQQYQHLYQVEEQERALFIQVEANNGDDINNGEDDFYSTLLLDACQGGCDRDSDCAQGLNCFHRSSNEPVPGCGRGSSSSGSRRRFGVNYCFDVYSTISGGRPSSQTQTAADADEQPEPIQAQSENADGDGDEDEKDQLSTVVDYIYRPGHWTINQHGLLLSQGLLARVIAEEGAPVRFDGVDSRNGGRHESDIGFHERPDGAAVFSKPGMEGWVYVSNSEGKERGGVGAIYFNAQGQVLDYKMILTGTKMNCGGSPTFWNTWLTCEEHESGRVWEVDPWDEASPKVTVVGAVRAKYESAAYDNRNKSEPKFYVSIDEDDGPLLRFTPSPFIVDYALENDDYSSLLHTRGFGTKWEYLVLDYNQDKRGTFSWTSDIREGRDSASRYFQGLEGVDVYDGMLYMTAKEDRLLFILDLDNMTFVETSTDSGAFDGAPDQVKRLLDDDGILYFCEDGEYGSGVHGRDLNGNYFTILQADDQNNGYDGLLEGETSGLAFSPDKRFMYVAFQKEGKLFEVRRADGQPFNGRRLDIRYHNSRRN